jgi:hypothetical protein
LHSQKVTPNGVYFNFNSRCVKESIKNVSIISSAAASINNKKTTNNNKTPPTKLINNININTPLHSTKISAQKKESQKKKKKNLLSREKEEEEGMGVCVWGVYNAYIKKGLFSMKQCKVVPCISLLTCSGKVYCWWSVACEH